MHTLHSVMDKTIQEIAEKKPYQNKLNQKSIKANEKKKKPP